MLVRGSVHEMHEIGKLNVLDLVRSESQGRLFVDDLIDRGLAFILFECKKQLRKGALIEGIRLCLKPGESGGFWDGNLSEV